MSTLEVAMATEIDPPVHPKCRSKSKPPGTLRKTGAPRPYRKITEDVLATRITKLTERLERSKKQHENTRLLLTRYAHERFYREKDAIQSGNAESAPPGVPPLDS